MRREQQKESRRRAIIHATETLIRETGSVEFSMIDLGKRAGLSTATTYNLIGSKATVLYLLLNRSLAKLYSQNDEPPTGGDAVEHFLAAADIATQFFTADPKFYKPLMMFLLGVPNQVNRPKTMSTAYAYWTKAVEELFTRNAKREGVLPEDVARCCHIFFAGALDLWVQDELSDQQFQSQVRHGVALQLFSLGDPRIEARLLRELRCAGARLPEMQAPSE